MNPVYLLDFSNFVYKFKNAYSFARVEINGVAVDTSVLYGFSRALRTNIMNNIAIVLDGVPTRSLALLPEYKGTRNHESSDICSVPKLEVIMFLTSIGKLLNKNVSVVCSPCQETDEVISSLVHMITNNCPSRFEFLSKLNSKPLESDRMLRYLIQGNPVISEFHPDGFDSCVIGSTDGDFIQLQRFPNVAIDTSSSVKKVSSDRKSKSTELLNPTATILYKAIYGDKSDNIPAIDLNIRKDSVIKIINTVHSDNQLKDFYNAAVTGAIGVTDLHLLANEIYKTNLSQFKINWEVAHLKFVSIPIKLDFPGYDIQETLFKYKLKIS